MVRPVTAGLNGTTESLAAARWAAREAERRNSPLQLLYVWEALPSHLPPPPPEPGYQRDWPDRMLGDAAADVRARHPDLPITAEQIENRPVATLLQAARDSDLLVLGSRGLGSVAGFLSGSVSLSIVARAERPVVLVRGIEADDDRGDVIVGLDTAHPCEPLMEFACEAAVRRAAPLRAIRVWRPAPAYGDPLAAVAAVTILADIEAGEREALQVAVRPWREKYPGLAVHEGVVCGNPARELIQAASGAALLIIGRRTRRPPLGTHIGAVAHAVIHHAACPVVIVPHE